MVVRNIMGRPVVRLGRANIARLVTRNKRTHCVSDTAMLRALNTNGGSEKYGLSKKKTKDSSIRNEKVLVYSYYIIYTHIQTPRLKYNTNFNSVLTVERPLLDVVSTLDFRDEQSWATSTNGGLRCLSGRQSNPVGDRSALGRVVRCHHLEIDNR
ncbi:hypothetical protein EVAR_69366_1 [Eumeta japonica]|uniref:Uncharacterized protein n=1 Tax=Eumeta variegata TaxID=151549 RepID=A0A4C1TBG9_EUMVA|nr:hypothetical protein EVAR_69366_1 [Eumeta japonica]